MSNNQTVLVMDMNNAIYRSFFAVPLLKTSTGQATNAIFGSLKSLKSLITELHPDFIISSWDSGKKNFRHTLDPNYKVTRNPTSDDLKSQFSLLQKALTILNVPQITAPDDAEGDDLTGSLAVKIANAGMNCTIASNDRDFYQLINNNIKVYSFTKAKKTGNGLVDENYVKLEYGVNPNQLIHVKSLVGEAGDNIKGIDKIGPKTGTTLINEYGDVHKLLNFLENNPDNKYYKIYEQKHIVYLALSLAKIKTDLEIPNFKIKALDKIIVNRQKLKDFFTELEMNSFLKELNDWIYLFNWKTNS